MKRITLYFLPALLILNACTQEEKNHTTQAIPTQISKVMGIGRIEPEDGLLYIYSNKAGIIETIIFNENDLVQKGSVLIELSKNEELSQIALEKSKISNHNASVEYAQEMLKIISIDLQNAKNELELNKKLLSVNALTEQAVKDSRTKVEKLTSEYNKQLAEINQVKSKSEEIQANIHYKQVLLAEKSIRAPSNGKILQWDIHLGDFINAGQKLGQFAPVGALVAVTEVDELFADKVNVGMKAEILSQLDGQKLGEGEIIFVADFLKRKSLFSDESVVEDRRVRTVKIRLNSDCSANINARVDCMIHLK